MPLSMSSLTEASTSNALRPNLDSSLTSRIPMRFALQYSIASHNTGRSSFFFAPEMCYSKTLRISIPLYFAYSDKSSKVFRRAIYAIIHFGTEQHESIFAPSEAADIKSVMQEYGETTEQQKAVGAWLCDYAESQQPFDETKHRHTLNEVDDVAEGKYDWKIERGRGGISI